MRSVARRNTLRAPFGAVSAWHSRRRYQSHDAQRTLSREGEPTPDTLRDDEVQTRFPGSERPSRRGPPSELDRIVSDLHNLNKEQRASHLRAKVAASPEDVSRVVVAAGDGPEGAHTHAEAEQTATTTTRTRTPVPIVSPPPAHNASENPNRTSVPPRPPPSWSATLQLESVAFNPALDASTPLDAADMSAISFTLEELDEHLFNASAEQPAVPAPPPEQPTAATTTGPSSDMQQQALDTPSAPVPPAQPQAAPSPPMPPSTTPLATPSVPPTSPAASVPSPPLPPEAPAAPSPPAPSSTAVPPAEAVESTLRPPPFSPPPPPPPQAPRPSSRAAAVPAPPAPTAASAAVKPVAQNPPRPLPMARPVPASAIAQATPTAETESTSCVKVIRDEEGGFEIELVGVPSSLRTLIHALQDALDGVEASLSSRTDGNSVPVRLRASERMRVRPADKVATEHLFFTVAAATASEAALTPLERLRLNAAKDQLFRRVLTAPQRGWHLAAHLYKGTIAQDFGAELLFCCHQIDLSRARGGIVSIGLPSLGLGVFPSAIAVHAFASRLESLDAAELVKLLQCTQAPSARISEVLALDAGGATKVSPTMAAKAAADILLCLHRQDESATGFNRLLAASPTWPHKDVATGAEAMGDQKKSTLGSRLLARLTQLAHSLRAVSPLSSFSPASGDGAGSRDGRADAGAHHGTIAEAWRHYCELSRRATTSDGAMEASRTCLLAAARSVEAINGRRVFLDVNRTMALADYAQGGNVVDDAHRYLFVTADNFSSDDDAPGKVRQALASMLEACAASEATETPVLLFLSHEYPPALSVQVLASIHAGEVVEANPSQPHTDRYGRYVPVLAGTPGQTAECASVVPLSVTVTAAGVPSGRATEEALLLHASARTRPDRARDAQLLGGLVEISVRASEDVPARMLDAAIGAAVGYLQKRRVPYVVVASGCASLRLAIALSDAVLSATEVACDLAALDAQLAVSLHFARSPVAVVTRHFGFRSVSFDEAHRRFPRESARLSANGIFALSKGLRRGQSGRPGHGAPSSATAAEATAAAPSSHPPSPSDTALAQSVESVFLKLLDAACTLVITGEVQSAKDMNLISIAALSLHPTSGGLLTVAQQRFGGAAGVLRLCARHSTAATGPPPLSSNTQRLLAYMVERDVTFDQLTSARLAQFRASGACE